MNKATLIEQIAELVREKRIEGISDLRDEIRPRRHAHRHRAEARRHGRRGAEPALPLHAAADDLRRQHGGAERRPARAAEPEGHASRPSSTSARRSSRRRTKFLLDKARERAHVLVGLAIAVANIDEVIRLIRTAPDPNSAREALMGRDWPARRHRAADRARSTIRATASTRTAPTACPKTQARAILDLRLQRLTGARPRRDRRRAEQARRRDRGLSRHPALARRASWRSSRTSWPRSATPSPRRAAPRSSMATPTSTTRT